MPESRSTIEFTVILYGIVASNALFRLPYAIELRTGMLLFAFFILAADWIEYQLTVYDIPNTVDNTLLQFGVDILILVVWTFLTVVPPRETPVFTGIIAVFVLLQWLWDLLLDERTQSGLILQAELELAVVLGLLLVVHSLFSFANTALFALTVGLFLVWKASTWKLLYFEAKRSESPPTI